MANPKHLKILKQGVEQWNKWREEHPGVRPDLSGEHLDGADLQGANLSGANLEAVDLDKADLRKAKLLEVDLTDASLLRANLGGSDLTGSDLYGADLIGATLTGADLRQAKLVMANLRGANLKKVDLFGSFLNGTNLQGADLQGANLSWAILIEANLSKADVGDADFTRAVTSRSHFADVDLSAAKGLETVEHRGPSTIGIDTIYKSRGKIPEAFLRGCGVPDEFIAYIGSMMGRAIEFYSCFISYSTKDQEFADRLHTDLQAKGVRCWFAPHDIQGGKKSTNRSTKPFSDTTGCC